MAASRIPALLVSTMLVLVSVAFVILVQAWHVCPPGSHHGLGHNALAQRRPRFNRKDPEPSFQLERRARRQGRPDTAEITGSRPPDCSYACGSCSPCRLVMVSLVCSSLEEAETCPMAYKCMCNNKSYPVP